MKRITDRRTRSWAGALLFLAACGGGAAELEEAGSGGAAAIAPAESTPSGGKAAPPVEVGGEPQAGAPVEFRVPELSLFEGESGHIEFGKVVEGVKLTHVFQLVGAGLGDSRIGRMVPSCKCTRGKIYLLDSDGKRWPYEFGGPIAPGTRLEIEMHVSTHEQHSDFHSALDILTEGAAGRLKLTMHANPISVIGKEGDLNFGRVVPGWSGEVSMRFSSEHLEPFQVRVLEEGTAKHLQIELVPLGVQPGEPSRNWEVRVVGGPFEALGSHSFPIKLETDARVPWPKYPSRRVMYSLDLVARVDVGVALSLDPRALSFGTVSPGESVFREARLEVHDDFVLPENLTTRILVGKGPEGLADLLLVEIEPAPDGAALVVRLRLASPAAGERGSFRGAFGGRVEIDVKHPETATLRLRFAGNFGN